MVTAAPILLPEFIKRIMDLSDGDHGLGIEMVLGGRTSFEIYI